MSSDLLNIIDEACCAFYAGDMDEVLRLLREAKRLHESLGGDASNWIGMTDDRAIFDLYSYNAL